MKQSGQTGSQTMYNLEYHRKKIQAAQERVDSLRIKLDLADTPDEQSIALERWEDAVIDRDMLVEDQKARLAARA